MPKIIDGNPSDLVEAEIDFAQTVEFRRSRQIEQSAFLHDQNSEVGKEFSEIAGQIVDGRVVERDADDTLGGAVSVVHVVLEQMVADDVSDVVGVIGFAGEVEDSTRVPDGGVEAELAWQVEVVDRRMHDFRLRLFRDFTTRLKSDKTERQCEDQGARHPRRKQE